MGELLQDLLVSSASNTPTAPAVSVKGKETDYAKLLDLSLRFANVLHNNGIEKGDRIAVYLPKQLETIVAMLGASILGAIFVPINPLLKSDQLKHILNDCGVRLLVSSHDRIKLLKDSLQNCPALTILIIVMDADQEFPTLVRKTPIRWNLLGINPLPQIQTHLSDTDRAAILYTSGSTGKPKGVVLSHRNLVTGANSVTLYLNNQASDRILAVLPFSFDYGLSQLTTALRVGACVVLMEYLFPRDILSVVNKERITGIAAVPPLWIQLAKLNWPEESKRHLRYITSSGGSMPVPIIKSLQSALPDTQIFLMYGLTEAFRSTFLNPLELNHRPESIGKAIPFADIKVVHPDGSECLPGEAGELVHRGPLVAMGYWNDLRLTALRFKPWPMVKTEGEHQEIAVWSGDTVKTDSDGFFYFVGRDDDMIKTSGYRVSPVEIEDVIHETQQVEFIVVLGIPDPDIGQRIVAVVTPSSDRADIDTDRILAFCRQKLPAYMVPATIEVMDKLPKTANGKIDRKSLLLHYTN